MNGQDRAAFAKAMVVLGETFNEPVSDGRIEAYFDALSDLDIEAVLVAVRVSLRTETFFPKPINLRNLVLGSASDRAELGWAELMDGVRRVGYTGYPTFNDPAVMDTVKALWGTWGRLCETLPAEGPELIGWRKSFLAAYGATERRPDANYAALPAGIGDRLKAIAASKVM